MSEQPIPRKVHHLFPAIDPDAPVEDKVQQIAHTLPGAFDTLGYAIETTRIEMHQRFDSVDERLEGVASELVKQRRILAALAQAQGVAVSEPEPGE